MLAANVRTNRTNSLQKKTAKILRKPEDIALGVNQHTVRFYWQFVKQHKASFFTALVAIPSASLLMDALLPYFLSQAIGGLTESNHDLVVRSLVIAGVVGATGVTLNYIGFQVLVRHEAKVRLDLSNAVFDKLLNKDFRFFVNEKVGALTSRYIDFIRSHLTLQDLLIIRTLGFIISISAGLVIVATQSLLLAAILGVLITFIIVQVRISMKIRAPYRHKRKKMVGEIHGKVADSLTNNLIVKTFANEQNEVGRISRQNEEFRDIWIKDMGMMATEGSLRLVVMSITQIVAISVCAYLVLNGRMDIAIAIFILTYLQRIASQLFTLGEMINGYDQALLEAAPLSEILTKETTVNDKPDAAELADISPTINFQNASYRYEDDNTDVLKAFDLHIKAGEKIGLVGHSGAGKTTITHLLLRFSDVTGGTIRIDGHDIRDVTQASLRKHIAYVPQEPMLFHRTLNENISYGKPDATEQQVREAAKKAHAAEFIEKLPNGYETLVGERGVKLSGGQRQRIAIARAILKDAPILVLDEATSALDSESEKLIQKALRELMKNRTAIVIAHRLSTIQKMDRIVVLDNGRIAEQGTHSELLKQKGIYAELWSHQSGGFIDE